jgi:fumarate reductase iron-sulfur subunit
MAANNQAVTAKTSPQTGGGKMVILEVFRYLPDQEEGPRFQRYEIPFREDWVVLDALNYIKDQVDGSLSYRWSCRMGVCGSCGMMVNGEPKLTCAAFLKDYYPNPIRIEPLAHFPVIRDLVINLDDFLHKLHKVKAWLIPQAEKPVSEGEYLQTPAQLARYKQFSMCINCMLCYAACPVYGMETEFIGPAAIALARRYNLDSRDGGQEERIQILASHAGAYECTFVGECSAVCPKHVDPAAAIQQSKIESTLNWYRTILLPRGQK